MKIEIEELPGYDAYEYRHAMAILKSDFPDHWSDIVTVLSSTKIRGSHMTAPGGGKSKLAQELDQKFKELGWVEKKFETKIQVDNRIKESPTHKVDCVKGRVALEL
jgi:hypothetical protein